MTIRRIMGIGALVLGCGCAHRAATATPTHSPTEQPVMQLRRDNAALRRRVQMLEDRVLYLEQRGPDRGGSRGAVAESAGAHTLPDGRSLPVVRLAPGMTASPPPRSPVTGSAPRSTSGSTRGSAVGSTLGSTVGSTVGSTLGSTVGSSTPSSSGSVPFGPESGSGYAPEPELEPAGQPVEAARSYRLEGSRLVQLTTRNGPPPPDRPDRGGRGRAVIQEYEAAMAIYQSGQPERAESAFGRFARRHPGHDYADNALYWKGESAYDQRHYADALASFTEVIERYGGGNKAPDALLKIGLCYRQLGDLPNARDVLGALIAAYPAERASDIARVKLAELES
ncbi:MAG: tol-pal system protein YbgF [Myxococcota bacterium]